MDMLLFALSLLAASQASTDPNLFNGPGFSGIPTHQATEVRAVTANAAAPAPALTVVEVAGGLDVTLAGLDTCSGDSHVVTATRLDARVELRVATTARFADSLRPACEPSTTVEARVIPNGPVFEVVLVGEDGAELDRVDLLSDAQPRG